MNYNEHTSCQDCFSKTKFTPLKDTANYDCDQPCLCRYTGERSDKDRMMMAFYNQGKVPNLQPMPFVPDLGSNNTFCSKK